MGIFFTFEDNRYNLLVYFLVTTIVLYLGPGFFFRKHNAEFGVPLVDAPCGKLAGVRGLSRDGRDIFSYKGIPYAQPPLGELRFKRPQPPEGWAGTRKATKSADRCYQPFALGPIRKFHGSEDCLYLNVHVPGGSAGKGLLPVMVWIHGGGFTSGDGSEDLYGPDFLLDRDVILVTLNYRVGVLGFFSLDDASISGNQGMWDQREALRWVRGNIRAFGGDPERVTLFGESAGGAAVAYHLAAPESEGLFSAAILQSGSVPWNFLSMDHYKPLSHFHRQYARKIGCETTGKDSRSVTECLQKLDLAQLYSEFFMFDQCAFLPSHGMTNPATWKPINDADFSRDPFFTGGDPGKSMVSGEVVNVPVMVGFTKNEGLINTVRLLKDPDRAEMANNDPEFCLAQNALGVLRETYDGASEAKARAALKLYFGKDKEFDFGGGDFAAVTDLFTESSIAFASDFTKRSLVRRNKSDVFYYRFDHVGSLSAADILESSLLDTLKVIGGRLLGLDNVTRGLGVCHADDLFYLFKPHLMPFNFLGTEEDESMSRFMVDLWANFATFHDPTPKDSAGDFIGDTLSHLKKPWKRSKGGQKDGEDMAILNGATIAYAKSEPFFSRIKFWEKTYQEIGLI